MAALPASLARFGGAARGGIALLAIVALLAAGSSAAGGRSRDGSPPANDFPDAQAFVDAHNAVRAAVRKPAGYRGSWTAPAPVAWSDEVAGTAQAWAEHLRDANKCRLLHSDTRYGENLAAGKDLDVAHAVGMWAKEIDNFRYSSAYEFEIPSAHYSQVVWRKTTHIGCGRAACGRNAVIVCRYSPAGNRIGSAPY